MTRTLLDMHMSTAKAEVKYFTDKVETELKWLEGHIRDLRGEVERGNLFEQINLVTAAARAAHSAGKLRAAQENLANYTALAKELVQP